MTPAGVIPGPQLTKFASGPKPKFTRTGIVTAALSAQVGEFAWARAYTVASAHSGYKRTDGSLMSKTSLISIVEDDRFFRESMKRLLRSLGYTVEAFPSAAHFLESPRLAETACLIADVHMPAMTGIELRRHLRDAAYAIPTIIVTAYPNDVDRARALNDGVVCYLSKPIDESRLISCLHAALRSGESPE